MQRRNAILSLTSCIRSVENKGKYGVELPNRDKFTARNAHGCYEIFYRLLKEQRYRESIYERGNHLQGQFSRDSRKFVKKAFDNGTEISSKFPDYIGEEIARKVAKVVVSGVLSWLIV